MTKACIYNCRGELSDAAWFQMKVWLQEGITETEVARRLNVAQSTINRAKRQTAPPSEREQPKRSLSATVVARRQLVKRLVAMKVKMTGSRGASGRAAPIVFERKRYASAWAIAQVIGRETKNLVSPSTIRTDLRAIGFKSYVIRKGPLQKEGDKATRVAFSRKMLRTFKNWNGIISTDEKWANTNYHGVRRSWEPKGEKPPPGGNEGRFASSVHVWAAVGVDYRKLVILPSGGITGPIYRKSCVNPTTKELKAAKRCYTWQHDNARPHTASESVMKKTGVTMLPVKWPARSPDLSPVETIWALVQKRVDKHCCSTPAELRKAWTEEFMALPQSHINKTVLSFRRRLTACVKAKGAIVHVRGRTIAEKKRDAARENAAKNAKKRK
jgi:transposase